MESSPSDGGASANDAPAPRDARPLSDTSAPRGARPLEDSPLVDVVPGGMPDGMLIAGSWAWRVLAVAGVVALVVLLVARFPVIVIPLVVAILLAALLLPGAALLQRHGWPRWTTVLAAIVVVLGVLVGLGMLVATEISSGLPSLVRQTLEAYRDARGFLTGGPFHFTHDQLHTFYRDVLKGLQANTDDLVARAASVGSWVGRFVTGLLLAAFATVILLIDGAGVWRFLVGLVPRRARLRVDEAGRDGWTTLTRFVRMQLFVALVDAVGIGLVAGILGIPLAIPIAVAVFIGSFVPIVGAVVTGIVAVFVALVYNGPVAALVMLAGVLVVQSLEGYVLQRLVTNGPVKVHPLAVVFGVALGTLLAGVAGALFAVPVIATLHAMARSIASRAPGRPHRLAEDDMVLHTRAAEKGTSDDV
ncbi:AI-2E family transporter [Frondihabitans peucedani]|uniref:PurR-regulated permease PerM n=1 Tax=Frondihabitans peucedani TaxID=598626 RepID=A0ABP8E6A7_9MICO